MQSFLINSTRESLNTFYNFLIKELWKAKPLTTLIAGSSHKLSIDFWVEWTSDFENVEHLQHMTSNNWCLDNWHLNVPLLTSVILCQTLAVVCPKYTRSMLFPFSGQLIIVPAILTHDSGQESDQEWMEVELLEGPVEEVQLFTVVIDSAEGAACSVDR